MSTEPQWAAGAWGCTETAVGAGQACRARAAALSGHAFRLRRGPVGSADDPRTLEDLCGPGPPLPREPQSERTGGRPGPVLLRLSVPRARRRGDAGVALNRARPPASRVRAAPPPQARNPYSCASYKIRIIQFQ